MEKIEKKLIKHIEVLEKKFGEKNKVNDFEETNQMFKDMIKKGIAKKRGYMINSVDEHQRNKVAFSLLK